MNDLESGQPNTYMRWADDATQTTRALPIEWSPSTVTIWCPDKELYTVVDNMDGTSTLVYG